jgi:hypothetical protein
MSLSSDYPVSWGSGFQDPASDWLICLIDLHDQIVFYLIMERMTATLAAE